MKVAIREMARDFIDREEYNAYKHGLRIIPSVQKLSFVPLDESVEPLEMEVSDSMSFFTKQKNPKEIQIVTKVYDSERDYRMTTLCSTFIHQIIYYRRALMKGEGDSEKFRSIIYYLYDDEKIKEFTKANIEVNDIIYTQTEVKES